MNKPDLSKLPKSRHIALYVAVIALVLGLLVGLTVWLWPCFTALTVPEDQVKFEAWVDSLGFARVSPPRRASRCCRSWWP